MNRSAKAFALRVVWPHILPIADFTFLTDVARESPRDARRAGF
jgi:hypothetical protein